MKDLIEILDYVKKSTLILVVSESRPLLEYFFDYIYHNYDSRKSKVSTNRHLKYKAICTKDKLLRIEIFLDKIQFDSAKSFNRKSLNEIKIEMVTNNSRILFKDDFRSYEKLRGIFDLVVVIYGDKICLKFEYDTIEFELGPKLIRKIKLQKIQKQI